MKDLESSLEKYMLNLPESPLLLSVKTKIFIERKNITIDHITFSPIDATDKIYDIVRNYFTNLGDEINFDDSICNFFIIRKEINCDINSEINHNQIEIPIKKGIKILSSGLTHGDVIYLKDNFSLKSEAPKSCLTYQFEEKHMNTIVNYFSCENCKLNWICHICADCCHKNHSIKLHVENHKVTWACCYCYRGKCELQNNKKK